MLRPTRSLAGCGGVGADHQTPGGAKDRKGQDWQEHRVEPGDYRGIDDLCIAHHFGNTHRGECKAGDDVRQNAGSIKREDALKEPQHSLVSPAFLWVAEGSVILPER
jgi:hypothetical protein